MSPLDWALIENWQERGVPLAVVLRSIEKVFDGFDKQPAKTKRPIKSLMYCREEIEAQYAAWLETQVGKNNGKLELQKPNNEVQSSKFKVQNSENKSDNARKSELFPSEMISAHFENVSEQLNAAKEKADGDFRGVLQKVINRLEKLKQNTGDTEKAEDVLEKLDAFIDTNLVKTFETEKLKTEIEKQLAAHRNKMPAEVYERTLELMLLKNLREKASVPRLSLFYL